MAETDPCYKTNNNYAYLTAVSKGDNNRVGHRLIQESKIINFVTTYKKICLNCGEKDAKYRCSGCKSVYFCTTGCQSMSWTIHKKHCTRDLFAICITCGQDTKALKCDNCPVHWCSEQCKEAIYSIHVETDCAQLGKIFN